MVHVIWHKSLKSSMTPVMLWNAGQSLCHDSCLGNCWGCTKHNCILPSPVKVALADVAQPQDKIIMNRLFATVLFLNHFGVTFPGFRQAINAWNSKQYCGVWFVFCFVFKLNCDSLKWYLWNQGISTTGLKKQCLVRLSTNVNNISVEQAGRQLKNPKTKKKELMVEKKRDLDLEQIGEGVGNGSKWGEWLSILAIATHGKQIKTQVKRKICKYPLSQVWKYCLKIMPPNQTTSSGYRAINK